VLAKASGVAEGYAHISMDKCAHPHWAAQ